MVERGWGKRFTNCYTCSCLTQPRRLGGQLPADFGKLLLLRHDGGDACQKLVLEQD